MEASNRNQEFDLNSLAFLLENAYGQYIDDFGKTRIIYYRYRNVDFSLAVSPIAPLILPSTERRVFSEAPLEFALNFINSKNWRIREQDADRTTATNDSPGTLRGLWLDGVENLHPQIRYAYLAVYSDTLLEDVPVSPNTRLDPIRVGSTSPLSTFRETRKLVTILKEYALYTYTLAPDNFGRGSFIIVPNHVYDLNQMEKKLYLDNPVIFRQGRMIVLSREMRNRLINYVRTKLRHDLPGVMAYAQKIAIDDFYQNISDFTPRDNQLIFVNRSGIERWKNNLRRNERSSTIYHRIREEDNTPYLYLNYNLEDGRLALIQNVNGATLEKALIVAKQWHDFSNNLGYEPDLVDPNTSEPRVPPTSYNIYRVDVLGTEVDPIVPETVGKTRGGRTGLLPSVISWAEDKFAAILWVENETL